MMHAHTHTHRPGDTCRPVPIDGAPRLPACPVVTSWACHSWSLSSQVRPVPPRVPSSFRASMTGSAESSLLRYAAFRTFAVRFQNTCTPKAPVLSLFHTS
eukprot:6922887-Prymnesium_polylepis.1